MKLFAFCAVNGINPAKKIKDISQELILGEIERIVNNYIKYACWYK